MTKVYHGKCPRCCPDGGACFERFYDYETMKEAKKCNNCGQVLPLRKFKPSGQPTRSQKRITDKIVALFGGEPKTKMIGRKVFITLHNPERNFLLGDSLFGTIGPAGGFKITLQRVGGDAVLTDEIGLEVYLRQYKK